MANNQNKTTIAGGETQGTGTPKTAQTKVCTFKTSRGTGGHSKSCTDQGMYMYLKMSQLELADVNSTGQLIGAIDFQSCVHYGL